MDAQKWVEIEVIWSKEFIPSTETHCSLKFSQTFIVGKAQENEDRLESTRKSGSTKKYKLKYQDKSDKNRRDKDVSAFKRWKIPGGWNKYFPFLINGLP